MAIQQRNDEMVNLLSADFVKSNANSYAWKCVSQLMALPGVRGTWPMSAISATGAAFDVSGNSRTLTYNGNPTYNYVNLAPYIEFDGTVDWLNRADEAGLDILGTETYVAAARRGLSMGGYFWLDSASKGLLQTLMGKTIAGAAATSSFWIDHTAGALIQAVISDGAANTTSGAGLALVHDGWHFVAMTYDPSASLTIYLDDSFETNAVAIPAAINNSAADFTIGGRSAGTSLMDGRASMCWLCAQHLTAAMVNALRWQTLRLYGL